MWGGEVLFIFPLQTYFPVGPHHKGNKKNVLGLIPGSAGAAAQPTSLLRVTGAHVYKAQDAANATPNQIHSWVVSLVIKSQHDEALHLIAMALSPTGGGIQAWYPTYQQIYLTPARGHLKIDWIGRTPDVKRWTVDNWSEQRLLPWANPSYYCLSSSKEPSFTGLLPDDLCLALLHSLVTSVSHEVSLDLQRNCSGFLKWWQ